MQVHRLAVVCENERGLNIKGQAALKDEDYCTVGSIQEPSKIMSGNSKYDFHLNTFTGPRIDGHHKNDSKQYRI